MRQEIAAVSLMRGAEAARARAESLASVSKDFDEGMLGQGKKEGGSKVHRDNRMDCLERVKRSCDALPPELEVDWERFKALGATPRFCSALSLEMAPKPTAAEIAAVSLRAVVVFSVTTSLQQNEEVLGSERYRWSGIA